MTWKNLYGPPSAASFGSSLFTGKKAPYNAAPMTQRNPASVRILVADELHPDGIELLRSRGFEPELAVGLSEEDLIQRLPGIEALLVRSATKVTSKVLRAAPDLTLVGRAGVGVDNVDLAAASSKGVVVMNTPTGNTVTTGELAISLLCALARNLTQADRRVRAGTWNKKGLLGTELAGKTLGIVGLGRIGRVVADRALGLSMKVLAHDPFLTSGASPMDGVELLELDDLLSRSDFVSLHVPLTDSTRNLISRERLALMKPGARLINAARGGLVDDTALADALESGHLKGAALDVLAEEPPSSDHPLLQRDDVILTPHLGASSHEAQRAVSVGIAEQTMAFFLEGVAHNAVNAPVLSTASMRVLGPYGLLAGRMGALLAQLSATPIAQIDLTTAGEIAELDEGPFLEYSLLAATLGQSLDIGVNLVNAPLLAADRGIRCLRGRESDSLGYRSLLRARVSNADGSESHTVCGTVFGGEPRIVEAEGARVDFAPRGHLLVTRHRDRPGVIGLIGSLLGTAGVNIRRVELAPPHGQDELAAAFMALYDAPDPKTVAAIGELEMVVQVHQLSL